MKKLVVLAMLIVGVTDASAERAWRKLPSEMQSRVTFAQVQADQGLVEAEQRLALRARQMVTARIADADIEKFASAQRAWFASREEKCDRKNAQSPYLEGAILEATLCRIKETDERFDAMPSDPFGPLAATPAPGIPTPSATQDHETIEAAKLSAALELAKHEEAMDASLKRLYRKATPAYRASVEANQASWFAWRESKCDPSKFAGAEHDPVVVSLICKADATKERASNAQEMAARLH